MSQKYQKSGVNLTEGRRFVEDIKPLVHRTRNPGVMDGIGGFGAGFDLSMFGYQDPVLVSGTDGVGTKLKLALLVGKHRGIGIDLVAMSVNDVLVCGAKPLFFLDYLAMGKLDRKRAVELIEGITDGCLQTGCALIGGETAEMPGVYEHGDYDLAGFCVGAVERAKMLNKENVEVGDYVYGVSSSGPHSNGYSLIRKLVTTPDGKELNGRLFNNGSHKYLDMLIEPTRIYVKPVLSILEKCEVHAMAHITGGGFFENIPRSVGAHQKAMIDARALKIPPVFEWLCELGQMKPFEKDFEPFHVWNMGTGFVIIAPPESEHTIKAVLGRDGMEVRVIGKIEESSEHTPTVEFYGI